MNQAELDAIRKRVEKVSKGNMFREVEVLACNNSVVFEDVPKLLAEIERLRADQERLIAELKKADIFSEELERKYFAAKWPEVEANIKKYAAKIWRERNGRKL